MAIVGSLQTTQYHANGDLGAYKPLWRLQGNGSHAPGRRMPVPPPPSATGQMHRLPGSASQWDLAWPRMAECWVTGAMWHRCVEACDDLRVCLLLMDRERCPCAESQHHNGLDVTATFSAVPSL